MKRTAYGAFLLLGLIWGSNFIFIKWAAASISPAQIVLLRVVFGFLPLLAFALITQSLHRRDLRHAHHFLVMALLATALYYVAFAKGTVLLLSSVAGMLSGAIPLFTFVTAWLFGPFPTVVSPAAIWSARRAALGEAARTELPITVNLRRRKRAAYARERAAGAGRNCPEQLFRVIPGGVGSTHAAVLARRASMNESAGALP